MRGGVRGDDRLLRLQLRVGGQYDSTSLGRCVAKACDGRIGTSRYGMAYYARDMNAVTAAPTSAAPSSAPTTAAPSPRPTTPAPTVDDGDDDCVSAACREDHEHSSGLDLDCCGVNGRAGKG